MAKSDIKIENLTVWDFDRTALTDVLKTEGKVQAREARRLVARKAISSPGEYPGKRTGRLSQTVRHKLFRNQMGVYITHNMRRGEFRYPFVLAYGSSKINLKPRKDYIRATYEARRSQALNAIRTAVKKSYKADRII